MSTRRHFAADAAASAIILIMTLGCALPWSAPTGLAGNAIGAGIFLPTTAIWACVLWRPSQTMALTAFVCGLLMDALTAGPLGYWALLFVLAASLAGPLAQRAAPVSIGSAWAAFMFGTGALWALAWGIASLYRMNFVSFLDLRAPAIVAVATFPIVAVLVRAMLAMIAPPRTQALRAVRG